MPEESVWTRRHALGEAVRRRRRLRGLSQEELAEQVGFDRKSIVRLERGTHAVTIDRLWLVADALDVAIGDLETDALSIVSAQAPPRVPPRPGRTTPPG